MDSMLRRTQSHHELSPPSSSPSSLTVAEHIKLGIDKSLTIALLQQVGIAGVAFLLSLPL